LVTLFKDNLTEDQLARLGLNDRQLKAVKYIKDKAEITNAIYQEINNIGKTTATEDLQLMVELGVFIRKGNIGRGTKYV
jgi:ATP-dependent DNA helicase RecG